MRVRTATEKDTYSRKYSQALRLVGIIDMLRSESYVSIEDITDYFNISTRTAYRDINVLKEKFPIKESKEFTYGKGKQWSLDTKEKASCERLNLSIMEMASLFMGKILFEFTSGTELKQSIDQVFEKLSYCLSHGKLKHMDKLSAKFYCTPGSPKNYRAADDQLNEIVSGLVYEKKVVVEYKSPTGEIINDKVCPLSLVVHNNALYMIAQSENNGKMRTYSIERIISARWLRKETFSYPLSYSPKSYLNEALGIVVGEAVDIRLAISSSASEYFKQRTWHRSQRVMEMADGSLHVFIKLPVTSELVSWLLGFGAELEVLEPQNLRDKMIDYAQKILNLYNPGYASTPQPGTRNAPATKDEGFSST